MKKSKENKPNRLLDVPNMRDILDSVMRDIRAWTTRQVYSANYS